MCNGCAPSKNAIGSFSISSGDSSLATGYMCAGCAGNGGRICAGACSSQTHTIEIRELKFQPSVLTVKVRDTVKWTNNDIVPHTATSTKPKKFDSGILPVGSSWEYVAVKKGTYLYNCTLHPNMKGTLVVQ